MRREYRIQCQIEQSFSRKGLVAAAVQDMAESPEIAERLNMGEELLTNWINQDYWESKTKRLDQIRDMEMQPLADHVIGLISLECTKPMKLVSIAAMAAKYLGMNDKKEAIHTMAEIIAVLRDTKLYRIHPAEAGGYEVQSLLRLDESITKHKTDSCFVPPMVIRPRTVRHNRDSGNITGQGESLILGFYENHHDKDICLDVLNTLNRTEYSLNTDFLESVKEQYAKSQYSPEELKQLSEKERQIAMMDFENWKQFKMESKLIADLLEFHGNKFYLTHKVDKRGRIYSRGYHINTQGSSYRKAMIDLKSKEICTGVQEWTLKYVHNELLNQADADKLLKLVQELPLPSRMAGRGVGQYGKDYTYSGRTFKGQEVPDWLEKVIQWASKVAQTEFNSVLINHYPAGIPVGIGMHRDDEPELGENPAVLSISLGASCIFKVRSRDAGWKVHLDHGDVLLMKPGFQSVFTHGIDKTVFPEDRYSLTFRKFI